MYEWLIPFLILLGTFIPPVGGVIMANFFVRYRGEYPDIATAQLPSFNLVGLSAYAIGSFVAYSSTWVAPLVGVLVAAFSYAVLETVVAGMKARRAGAVGSV